ncbi:hypothetical protein [Anaerocolumna jejuensis]|uniref:hypothetical protein n=1 Tax=Anaerocolumna jejuensis TaxID=259063 RepID=UPI000933CCCF|nr:hypothetical protein [Anaerocolumna jejuensis]
MVLTFFKILSSPIMCSRGHTTHERNICAVSHVKDYLAHVPGEHGRNICTVSHAAVSGRK